MATPDKDTKVTDDNELVECGSCADDIPMSQARLVGPSQTILCAQCVDTIVIPMLKRAVLTQQDWNAARLGHDEPLLEARAFIDILGEDFVHLHEHKGLMFNTAEEHRIHCPHSVLANVDETGTLSTPAGARALERPDLAKVLAREQGQEVVVCRAYVGDMTKLDANTACPECTGIVCVTCVCPVIGSAASHVCGERAVDTAFDEYFGTLRRGVDYQRCPGCKRGYEQKDGCNYALCENGACRVGFCIICGNAAKHNSDHWKVGNPTGCSKWGKPGTEAAIFDPELEPGDEDEAREKVAVLDMPQFKECYAEAWKQELPAHPLPSWLSDARIRDQSHVACSFWTGSDFEAFERAEYMLGDFKADQQLTAEGYDALRVAAWGLLARPEILRQTLILADSRGFMLTLDREDDDVQLLVHAERNFFENKVTAERKATPGWRYPDYELTTFHKLLRSMEHVLRARGTSVEKLYPWTVKIAHSDRAVWAWHQPRQPSSQVNDTATFYNLLSPTTDRVVLDQFELILFHDPELFNACASQHEDAYRRGKRGPEYERRSLQHVVISVDALTFAMRHHRQLEEEQAHRVRIDLDSQIEWKNFMLVPPWLDDIPGDVLIVISHARTELSDETLANAAICGFDAYYQQLEGFYVTLRKLIWWHESSEKTHLGLTELRRALTGSLKQLHIVMPYEPDQNPTYLSERALMTAATRTRDARQQLSTITEMCYQKQRANRPLWLALRETRGELFRCNTTLEALCTESNIATEEHRTRAIAELVDQSQELARNINACSDELSREMAEENKLWEALWELDASLNSRN